MCLRNKSVETLWLYTEQIAPLSWVQLRPGECCDMPCGNVWYTIGASFDEPNPTAAVLGIFGFAATVLAVVVSVFCRNRARKSPLPPISLAL